MSFLAEEHLVAEKSKPNIVLNVTKGNVFADQTPTPTRFIRNCEEVGLFQDLQNVNPFEETFRKAAEAAKNGEFSERTFLAVQPDDTLHTPNIFPHIPELHKDQIKCETNIKSIPAKMPAPADLKTTDTRPTRKYCSKKVDDQDVVVLVNGNNLKVHLPNLGPKVKVFSPKYFSTFSKNALATASGDVIKNKPGRKKKNVIYETNSYKEVKEINRLAAKRSRNKKKHYLAYLEQLNKQLLAENTELQKTVKTLSLENSHLKKEKPFSNEKSVQTEYHPNKEPEEFPEKFIKIDESVKAIYKEHNCLTPNAMTSKTVVDCFYSTIPTDINTDFCVNNNKNITILKKPFKKRNLNSKETF